MSNPLNPFETELLAHLHGHLAKRPVRRRHRRLAAVGTTLALAGVVAAGTITLATLLPTAAYAVTENADGDVTITLRNLSDSEGLQAELAKHGITATVDYSAGSQQTLSGSSAPQPLPTGSSQTYSVGEESGTTPTGSDPTDPAFAKGCGIDPNPAKNTFPTVDAAADHATIRIPHNSIPAGKSLKIATSGGGSSGYTSLTIGWIGDNNISCTFGSATTNSQ